MSGSEIIRIAKRHGCEVTTGKGSHRKVKCPGGCATVVPVHKGEDLRKGTLHAIVKALEPCLGENWHRNG